MVATPPKAARLRRAALASLLVGLALLLAGALSGTGVAAASAATLTVDDTADRVDANVGNGQCQTSAGTCTLRAAIQESNALAGIDTVNVAAGVYELAIPALSEDTSATGDFDITDAVVITGTGGAANTIVDGGWPPAGSSPERRGLDRLFEIHRTAGQVTMSGLTLREGYAAEDGGAIQNWSPGLVRLEDVRILDSFAGKSGGGINNADPSLWPCAICPSLAPMSIRGGRVELVGSTVSGNAAAEGGAGLNNASTGTIAVLAGSAVTHNPGQMVPDPAQVIDPLDPDPVALIPGPGVYDPNSGAIVNQAEEGAVGSIRVIDSTVADNFSPHDGAGILNMGGGSVTVERSQILRNTTEGNGAGISSITGTLSLVDSTLADNLAHANGGAIESDGALTVVGLRARVTIVNSTLRDNTAWASGGGLANGGDTDLSLTDVSFTGNEAVEDAGGGLKTDGRTTLTATRTTFTDNHAYGEGGGMFTATERLVKVADSTFADGSAGVAGLEGNDAGGGGLYTETGPVTITDSAFLRNTATETGGGVSIDNHGDVLIADSEIRDNRATQDGGGVENSGTEVTFERVLIAGNRADETGGGIHNSSSGHFTVQETTIRDNRAVSGGGFTNASDSTLVIRRSLLWRNVARKPAFSEEPEDDGYGGGIYSISDGNALIENTTVSSNTADTRGGGMFHDADAAARIVNSTFWRNSAPFGGGISTVESDFVPSIPPQPNPLTLRNTIVGGSLAGGSCDAMLTSQGGNLDSGTGCMLSGPRDRGNSDPRLDALADNGGPTLTHAHDALSIAADRGLTPCVDTDQRGVTRPQNRGCDVGAFEYEGEPGPLDDVPPETTEPLSEPIQDGLETMAFQFTGTDDTTPVSELAFECRLIEHDVTEEPEINAPWDPIDPEMMFVSCMPGWQVPLLEAGLYTFEVRAVDRAGNVDPSPAVLTFDGLDTTPPESQIVEKPPLLTTARTATFTFSGTDNVTPPQFLEFECRLDSRDPELWLECTNPTIFSNLTTGEHTLEVRAIDGAENIERTPERYTWEVGQPADCDQANITLTAAADGWVDELVPLENFMFETELNVRSSDTDGNARTFVRFAIPNEAADCELESAQLRLYSDSSTPERTLQAVPVTGEWRESTLTWNTQPPTAGGAVTVASGDGYREWDVLAHVEAMRDAGFSNGWMIRDATEGDPEGGDQSFISREMPQDPPPTTLPQLVLRYEAAGTPPPSPPTPTTTETIVHCGQALTESTLVANDLLDCPGEGLVVAAPDIVVDLGGHTITSAAPIEPGEEDGLLAGIRNSGHRNVVIRNGTVRGFGYGVLLTSGTTFNVVEEMTLDANILAGVELWDADDGRNGNVIRDNTMTSNGEGAVNLVFGTENNLIEGNTLDGNAGVGFHLLEANHNRIVGNSLTGVPIDPLLDSDSGALLEGSSDNEFVGNTMSDTGDAGIQITAGSNRNLVERNTLMRNGDAGVSVQDSDHARILDNVSHQQSDGGVVVTNGQHVVLLDNDLRFNPSGLEAGSANDLVVERNDASDSLQDGFGISNAVRASLLDNVANRTGGSGISLESAVFDVAGTPVGGAQIRRNTTNQNRADGITVSAGGHALADNDAHNNAGWGISADEDSVDDGGNQAGGNGEPEQCLNVVCTAAGSVPLDPLDTTAPVTTILTHPGAVAPNGSATFTFSATDAVTPDTAMRFECRLDAPPDPEPEPEPDPDPEPPNPNEPPEQPDTPPDGVGWEECTSPVHFSGLDEGIVHRFEVRAIDHANNKEFPPAYHEWEIEPQPEGEEIGDTTPPSTRISSGPANPTTSTSATFAFAGSDNSTIGPNLRYACSIDGGAFEACTSTAAYSGLGVGAHTFEVHAIDRSGNVDPTPATHIWQITAPPQDTVAPETTIESGPEPITILTEATFDFSSNEQGATFECSLDGATFADCSDPETLTGLTVADHVLEVRAVDAAGNEDTTPASYEWTVGPAPVPAFVSCGQVVTRSIIVRNDISECLFDGLLVGAHGITIDLDGHTLDGKGLGVGIRNDGYDHVTIKNGRVREFDHGVALNTGTTRNVVEAVEAELNQESAFALGHPPVFDPTIPNPPPPPPEGSASGVLANTLRNNSAVANKRGLWLANVTRDSLIEGNTIAATDGPAVLMERSHANTIAGNEIAQGSGAGVRLEGSGDNVIRDNTLTQTQEGIHLGITPNGQIPSEGNRILRNALDESGGLEVFQSGENELLDNVVRASDESGLALEFANDNLVRGNDLRNNKSGIRLKTSSGNHLEDNDASGSGSTGIALESLSFSNVLLGNTSDDNEGDGIYVGDETAAGSGTRIENNTTSGNNGYGIFVPKVSHLIKGNTANDNGGWGIWVSEGSNGRFNTDGGGNRAVGNLGPLDPFTLQPLQCYTIDCSGGPPVSSDTISPDTTLLESPATVTTDDVATFRFTGSDNASAVEFQCSLDAAAFAPCTSPAAYGPLAAGPHTFVVRAVDASGNVDLTPPMHSWLIQERDAGLAPDTAIDTGPDLTTVKTTATFEFSADERGSSFECALDAAAFAPCGWTATPELLSSRTHGSLSLSGLTVGTHTFQVRATDAGGLTDASPAAWTWEIGPPPVPSEVSCGEILVQSTLVTNDLIDCAGHALIIGTDGITLDLDGHVLDGVGLDAGVLVNGRDSVTITNGTIREFDHGVQLNPGAARNVVSGLRLEFNQETGVLLSDADQDGLGNTIRQNVVVENSAGIALVGNTAHALVHDNALGGNAADGVLLEQANANRIEHNEIVGSAGAGVNVLGGHDNVIADNALEDSLGAGILVGEELLSANRTRISGNTVSDVAGSGIAVIDSTGSEVLNNTVNGAAGGGVALELVSDTLVRGNDLRFNASGIVLFDAHGNRIESNNASGGTGTGIEVEASLRNIIEANAAGGNSGDGIAVMGSAPTGQGNVLHGNTADGNSGDGIYVDGANHRITANTAQLNGGWGIYAPAGAIDGSGNFAAGNVEPGQCLGVVCSIGIVPGTPDTTIVSGPPDPSTSRNASFTYTGTDNDTQLHEMVWECRLDSTLDTAWQDCEYPQEYLDLTPGQHTFEVRAVDRHGLADPTPASHTWTYEAPLDPTRAPVVTIDSGPEAETWSLDALFTFSADEPDVTFECRVDGFAYEPCGFESVAFRSHGAFEWGLEETEVGPHTFRVRAIDFQGNVGEPAIHTWSLLGVTTAFLDGPGFTPGSGGEPATGGETNQTTARIEFEANVADATFECSIDLGPFVACSSPVTYTGLAAGEHLLRVIATDPEGVEQVEVSEYEWEIVAPVDETPPDTSIERAPADNSSSTIFEFAATDDQTPASLITFQCRLDSTSELEWFDCESPLNLLDLYTYADPQLAPGEHTFEVRAVDGAELLSPPGPNVDGNVDPTPASYTWTMTADTTPPGTAILSGPPASTGSVDAVFEFLGTDNATPELELTFQCAVDGGLWETCGSPESVQGLEPGAHTFAVRAVDLAGNADESPSMQAWTIAAAPVTTISSGPAAVSTSESASFVFTADQTGSTFECSLDGADFTPCASPHVLWVVSDGTHTLEVRAINPEGVVEDPAAVYEWTALLGPDATAPTTTITAGPMFLQPEALRISTSTSAAFEFTGSDNRTAPSDLVFECSLDGAPFIGCSSPHELDNLARGAHELQVRARDAAGIVDASPAVYRWSVSQPPVVTITSAPVDPSESRDVTFEWVSDVPATFECWLDGVREPCTSPKTYTGLADGEHLFAVLARDLAGNYALDWVEHEWEIGDVSAPVTTISNGPGVQTTSTDATFVFSADDPAATFECSLDGGDWRACSSPAEYRQLVPGQHRFEVRGITPNLLVDPVTTTYEWTVVDETPPDTFIDFGPPASTAATTAVLGFGSDDPTATFECSIDGQPFGSCESPVEYTDLAREQQHLVLVRAVDLAGNEDPTPESHTWTVTQPPATNTATGANVTVELPMPGGTGMASVTFASVESAGATWIEALDGSAPLPDGYSLGGSRYYELGTTALYTEPVTVCLAYDPASLPSPAARLLHLDGGVWTDITLTNNPETGRVCGEAESFSHFAIASANAGSVPLVSIISGPPNPSSSTSATFSFFADMADAFVVCSIDGGPFVSCESPVTYTHLEEGDHEFQAQAIGAFGIASPPAIYEWEIVAGADNTPPDTMITRGPGALTANFISTFEFAGTDDRTAAIELDFECSLDGGPFESCETPEEIEVLTAGEHTLSVRAVDLAGNADPEPATRTWTVVDMTAPETSIDTGPDSETTATSATFTFSGAQPDGTVVTTFDCSLDGASFAACTSPLELAGLATGNHVLQVRARDAAGNVDPTPELYEWTILGPADPVAPDTEIVSAPTQSGPEARFVFTSDRLVEGYECSLDGGAFEGCEAVHDVVGLSSGSHTLDVRAVDLLGTVDPTPAGHTWTATGVPDTVILTHPDDPSDSFSGTFTFGSDQDGVTYECAIDGAEFVPCVSPHVVGPLTNLETHDFAVRSVSPFLSLAGEAIPDESPASYSWTVDVPPDIPAPETTIDSGPDEVVAPDPELGYTFRLSSDDPMATFECRIVGDAGPLGTGDFESCEPVHVVDGSLPGGTYVLEARAVGQSEVVADPTPATWTWTIEAEPETTLLSASPAPESDSAEATFIFAADNGDATFQCSLDGGNWTDCASGVTFTAIPFGEHEFLVRAVAPHGTVDPEPASFTWVTGVMTAPVVTSLTGPDATTASTSATFTFGSDTESAQFQCSLDGAPFVGCTSPRSYTDLAVGPHTFEVQAVVPNLLAEPLPAIHEWTVVDDQAPETTMLSGPAPTTGDTTATFTFTGSDNATATSSLDFECSLDGGQSWDPCGSPHDLQGLEPGTYTLQVRAIDEALLTDPTPAERTWTVVGAPAITLTGPESPSTSTTASFTFTADQDPVTFECALDGGAFSACGSPHELTALAEGEHVLTLRATNAYGLTSETTHTWTVDVPPAPDTTIDSGPADPSDVTTAAFTFSSNQLDAGFECSLDGAAFAGCESGVSYEGLGEGAHVFAVRAVNTTGSADPEPARHEWTIDLPPDTFILDGPADGTVDTFAQFEFGSNQTATYECSWDGETWGSCESGQLFDGLEPGGHVLHVRAIDEGGNVDPTPATHAWTILPRPDTIIDSAPDALTEETTATFDFHSDDPNATFECSLDEAPYTACDSGITYTGLALEEHTFLVRAVDAAGNADLTPAELEWEVGTIPSAVTLTSSPTALSGDVTDATTAEFAFTGESGSFECSLDGAPFAPCTSPLSYAELGLGVHTFAVRALVTNPLTEPVPAIWSWTVADLAAPDTSLDHTLTPPEVTTSDTAIFAFTSELGASFECSLDGEPFASCTSPVSYDALAVGDHTFDVRAIDAAGNPDPSPASHAWTIVERPETAIDSGPASEIDVRSASFTFSSNQAGVTFECALDGGPFLPCTASQTFDALTDGDYTLQVRARNIDGFADLSPATYEWTVDAPAVTTILSGPVPSSADTTATFLFTASELDATFECALDGAAFSACSSPHELTGVAVGDHELLVRSVDAGGNVEPVAQPYAWTVEPPPDTSAPVTTFDTAPEASTESTTASFTFSANEAATFECSLDTDAFAACTSPVELSGLAVGGHEFRVRATDTSGNAATESYAWTVNEPAPTDTTEPQLSSLTRSGASPTNADSVTWTATFSEDVTGVAAADFDPVASGLSGAAVTDVSGSGSTRTVTVDTGTGNGTLRLDLLNRGTIADAAGNALAGPTSEGDQVTIDRAAPAVEVAPKTGQQTPTGTLPIEYTVTFSEPVTGFGAADLTRSGSATGGSVAVTGSGASYEIDVTGGLSSGTIAFAVAAGAATDEAGNASAASATGGNSVLHDASGPSVAFATPGAGDTVNGSVSVSGTATDAHTSVASVRFQYRQGASGAYTDIGTDTTAESGSTYGVTWDASALPAGSYELRVEGTDAVGNVAAVTRTVTVGSTCAAPPATLNASADSWVDAASASKNFGSDGTLSVLGRRSGQDRPGHALLKFAAPTVPAGCAVASVELRLYLDGISIKRARTARVHRVTGSWTEGGVNWNNRPAVDETVHVDAPFPTSTSSGTIHSWDVTTMWPGAASQGFRVSDPNPPTSNETNELKFGSRSNSPEKRPKLVITYR